MKAQQEEAEVGLLVGRPQTLAAWPRVGFLFGGGGARGPPVPLWGWRMRGILWTSGPRIPIQQAWETCARTLTRCPE